VKALTVISCLLFLLPALINAQESSDSSNPSAENAAFEEFIGSLEWQNEGTGELKDWATIDIPSGFNFLNGADADKLMQQFGNLPDEYEGMIAVDSLEWFVLFQFDDSGYVKDDEKDDLNADKMLKSMKESDVANNEYRQSQGLETLNTEGWAVEPQYNRETNNLEWGVILRSGSGERSVNYNTKLLGRNGVMHVTLVCDPSILENVLPTYQNSLKGFSYKEGKAYAEYRKGDKVAAYGLTALIAGGALYGAAKLGFLAKFILFFKKGFKVIIIGVIAIFVGIKKFFARITGGESKGRIS